MLSSKQWNNEASDISWSIFIQLCYKHLIVGIFRKLGTQRIPNWKPEIIASSVLLISELSFDSLVISKYCVRVLPHFLKNLLGAHVLCSCPWQDILTWDFMFLCYSRIQYVLLWCTKCKRIKLHMNAVPKAVRLCVQRIINPLNAKLNPICPLLALFGALGLSESCWYIVFVGWKAIFRLFHMNRYCCLIASKQTAVSAWQMPVAVCTVLNSWWWTERPSERL